MVENNKLTSRKVFNILYIGDYTKASPGGRKFADSLINNLLDKPASKGWMKIEPLPPITVSIVDIAETRQQAFEKLKSMSYDVVIADCVLDNKPNGAGIMSSYRDALPTALYISFFMPSQLKGYVRKKDDDVYVSDGAGLQRLYDKGFYNGFNKKHLNLSELINLIHAGGRSEEEAYIVYGLNYGRPRLEESTPDTSEVASPPSSDNTVDEKKLLLMDAAQLFPEFSIQQVQVFLEDANYNMDKLQVVSSMFHTKTNLSDPYLWVRNVISGKGDTASDSPQNQTFHSPGPVASSDAVQDSYEPAKETLSTESVQQDSSVETYDVNDGEKPLNRKQRRALKRREAQQASDNLAAASVTGDMGQVKEDTSPAVAMPIMAPSTDPYMQELEQMQSSGFLQERGTFNNGLVRTGVIHGNVAFAKGSMIFVELPMDIETLGLRLPDLYNAPVAIPYSIFGTGNLKRDDYE